MVNLRRSLRIGTLIAAMGLAAVLGAGCGGGGKSSASPVISSPNSNLGGILIPTSAILSRQYINDFSNIDENKARETNCIWNKQTAEIPGDVVAMVSEAFYEIRPYAQNTGMIRKEIPDAAEVYMVENSWFSSDEGAMYSGGKILIPVYPDDANYFDMTCTTKFFMKKYAHEFGHLMDVDRDEFMSTLFSVVLTATAYKNHPNALCRDTPLGSPVKDGLDDISTFVSAPEFPEHRDGAIATLLAIKDNDGDIHDIISSVSNANNFNNYLDQAKSFVGQNFNSENFDNLVRLYCDASAVFLEKNVPEMKDAILSGLGMFDTQKNFLNCTDYLN